MKFPSAVALLALLAGTTLSGGCGGQSPSDSAILQLAPAQATVTAGGTVALTGSATGLTGTWYAGWDIQEMRVSGKFICSYLPANAPTSAPPCPYGYVISDAGDRIPNAATYHAPATPGTYHVLFEVTVFGRSYEWVSKTVTATITVTP